MTKPTPSKMPAPTKEQELMIEEPDLQERITGFNNELKPLLGKYELGIAAIPKITPDGRIAADPTVVSMRRINEAQAKAEAAKKAGTPAKPGAVEAPKGAIENPED